MSQRPVWIPPVPEKERAHWNLVTARDLMRTQMITIDRNAPLSEAARLLIGNAISGAPVTDARGLVVGVVSLRDLVERYAEDPAARPHQERTADAPTDTAPDDADEEDVERDLEDELAERDMAPSQEGRVEDVMTSEIRSVPATASLPEIAEAMKRHSVHRLLVEDQGRYVGLIGTLEVLDVLFP